MDDKGKKPAGGTGVAPGAAGNKSTLNTARGPGAGGGETARRHGDPDPTPAQPTKGGPGATEPADSHNRELERTESASDTDTKYTQSI